MDRIEIINKLNEMKDVLMERGWTKTRLENPDGNVCILGARNLVTCGSTLYDESMTGSKDGYVQDDLSMALAEALDPEFVEQFYPNKYEDDKEANLLYLYNDMAKTEFNDMIDLIDTAIVKQKEAEGE